MTMKILLSASGIIATAIAAIFGYGVLHSNVSANAGDVDRLEMRLERVEDRTGDIRERLKGIEVIQQQQNDTLKRILRAVEGQ